MSVSVFGLLAAGALVVSAINADTLLNLPWVLASVPMLLVAWLLVLRVPENRVGWLFFWIVVAGSMTALSVVENVAWLNAIAIGVNTAAISLLALLLLIFPDGELPSPRWKPMAGVVIANAVFGGAIAFLVGGWGGDVGQAVVLSPFYEATSNLTPVASVIHSVGMALGFAAALVSLGIRYRREARVGRQQLKWLLVAVAYFLIALVVTGGGGELWQVVVLAVGLALIPIAIGVAVLRYRLYEVDLVISRSITFGLLAVFIGLIYVGLVVGLGSVLSDSTTGLSIAAIVIVAIAFQPVRRRVERWANRLVYGERATPYEVLAQFSRRSAELSHEELMQRIPKLIVDGTSSESAAVWIRTASGFGVASSWPQSDEARIIRDVSTFSDPDADYSLPVFHDGELLGGLSLAKVRGESISPADEALLADLAGAMGLVLRNAALTVELRQQVAELEASRERILAAADQARRDLERDLDSGPQQRLVALKVKLGPIRKLAERAGAEKTAGVLGQLEAEAGAAIQAVRDFAGGIYPPLLEAEGLPVAITQQARKAAFPVSVNGDGLGRYSRDVEAAVYFSVLEALQNTAKYANASSASVSLADTGKELLFEVRDDGDGFDAAVVKRGAGLAGMADRLDTVGGRVTINSTPGQGTAVAGAVPVGALVGG